MLTAAQIAARDGKLTASAVACLMTVDIAKMAALWRRLIGDPSYVDEDLSGVWPVRLGEATETLNLDWYERTLGRPVTRRGESVSRPGHDWAACTLDGWDDGLPGPVEAKHVGGREPMARILDRYRPQVEWQMLVTGATRCVMTIIEGTSEPVIEFIDRDEAYSAELWRRALVFMRGVWDMVPPVALEAVAAPVKAERTVDMAGSNSWASDASAWLTNRGAAKIAVAAEKALKAAVPPDAAKAHGHGVQITRNRAGSLSLREIAE